VVDLSPQPYLGLTTPAGILIDDDGAQQGWKYEGRRTKDEAASTKSFDLLTVVLHEMGHVLGLDDVDPQAHAGVLMAGSLASGEQRTVAVWERGGDENFGASPEAIRPLEMDLSAIASGGVNGVRGQGAAISTLQSSLVGALEDSATLPSSRAFVQPHSLAAIPAVWLPSRGDLPGGKALRSAEDWLDELARSQSNSGLEADAVFAEW
jgi:hypothetical protein